MKRRQLSWLAGLIMILLSGGATAATSKELTPLTQNNRILWNKLIQGENLAAGKKVRFAATPDYNLTAGEDQENLTDLRLSSRHDDALWFDKLAVGWRFPSQIIFIDLDKTQPVSYIVARFLGGGAQRKIFSPKEFVVYVSQDGNKYFKAASMQKLMPGEAGQSDFEKFYYLEENETPFAYPFNFKINADARYLAISVNSSSYITATDEIAVIKAGKDEQNRAEFNRIYRGAPAVFCESGVLFGPRTEYFAVTGNITTPSFFTALDMRNAQERNEKLTFIAELPPGLELLKPNVDPMTGVNNIPLNKIGKTQDGYIKWALPLRITRLRHDHIFTIVKAAVPADSKARFYVMIGEKKGFVNEVPVKIINVPQVPKLDLFVCLTWMSLEQIENWPDFFNSYKTMGFNAISYFPRYYDSPQKIEKLKQMIISAQKEGLKMCQNNSPIVEMLKKNNGDKEFFCQVSGENANWPCPSYVGKHYQEMLRTISQQVIEFQPDIVCLDIEEFGPGGRNAHLCSRCRSGREQSGKDMATYLLTQGNRMNRDIKLAVSNACNGKIKMPVWASYDKHALHRVYHNFEDFTQNFPEYLDQAQPSLYVAGNPLVVHNEIRQEYFLLNKNKKAIFPWLTAGTYGEFEPYKLEQMILEALMNGAAGINYFAFYDFDTPMDFFYHAHALSLIAPYQKLITDGDVLTLEGTNKQLTYSVRRNGDEMLLLVGNYKNCHGETQFMPPYAKVSQVKDVVSGQEMPLAGEVKFNVEKESFRLFYIKGK